MSISRYKGDTFPVKITVTDQDTGSALDITGNTFQLTVATEEQTEAGSYEFQINGTITDAVNGKVEFPFTTTEANHAGVYQYDIRKIAGGEITTIKVGTIIFNKQVTP